MAALLPTILSDDDDEECNNDNGDGNRFIKKDGGKTNSISLSRRGNLHNLGNKTEILSSKPAFPVMKDIHDSGDDDDDDDEMDQDFEFGGLLVRLLCVMCTEFVVTISMG